MDMTLNSSALNDSSCAITFTISESNLVMFLTVLENSAALAVIFTVRTPSGTNNNRTSGNTHFLIRLLAGNDFLSAGLILLSDLILTLSCDSLAGSIGCELLGWLAMSSYCCSLHIVCVMNVERYFMVCRPVLHRNRFSPSMCGLLLGLGAGAVFVILGLPLLGVGVPYFFYDDNKVCGFDMAPRGNSAQKALIGLCGCLGIAWVTLTALANIAINRALGRKVGGAGAKDTGSSKQLSTFSTVAKVVAVVNSVMTLPFYIKLLVAVALDTYDVDSLADNLTFVLWLSTSLVNPVIYIACNNIYRRQFLKPFRKLRCIKRTRVESLTVASE